MTIVLAAVAGFSLVLAGWYYREARRWGRQAHARIAVSYKRKVQLQAPLVELVHWSDQIERDQQSGGRELYRARDVSVSLITPVRQPSRRSRLAKRITRVKHNQGATA